ncbi:T9SS type A sorting domain-containing protein [candidate division KSB1 bacterium]|nr:T9SS type A sorting domain-containing protein [candidate division KSB1 bacterium]
MKTFHVCFLILVLLPIYVLSQVGPITINSTTIDDDNRQFSHDESMGNGNHILEAGEKIRLIVKLQNEGSETALQVYGTLACDNTYISFSDSVEEYKDINPGSTASPYHFFTGYGGFLFEINSSCPSGQIQFTLTITSSNSGEFVQTFNLDVTGGTAGPITIGEYRIDDDNSNFADDKSQGDGNQKIDPGETIGIDLKLSNEGTLPAINYSARMRTNYPGIIIIDSVLTYSVINGGSSAWPDDYDFGHQFQFQVPVDIVPGSAEFTIIIYNNKNEEVNSIPLSLTIEAPGTVLLEISSVYFDDDQEYYTNKRVIGNGNDIMEPRETIEVTTYLQNNGTGSALGVKAILHNNSPHLAIVDSVEDFATIRGGSSGSPEGWGDDRSFIVKILNTAPTGDILCPVEITTTNAAVYYDTLAIPVDASNTPPPGSVIILTSPEDGVISRNAIITVKGYVDDPVTSVFLNGDSILCENGSFIGYLLNQRGNNFINVTGINSQGIKDSATVKVIGEPYNTYDDKVKFYLHNKATGKIDYNYLSEYAPYSTTSEVSYHPTTPDSMEWAYPLENDIEGDQYSFSLKLASYSTTNYDCRILIRHKGEEQIAASARFNVSTSDRYEQTVTGIDPETSIGDTLVFRLVWDKSAHFWLSKYTSDLFFSSLSTSEIYVPWFKPTEVEQPDHTEIPTGYKLMQNYPNPFNLSTFITFSIPKYSNVDISIYNVSGQLIKQLVNKKYRPGQFVVHWDGTGEDGMTLPSGLYLCRIKTKEFFQVIKMTLVK